MVSRRAVIGGGAGAAVLAGLGYRAWDRGVFSAGEGEAFAPWAEWQGKEGEGIQRPLHAGILAASPHNTQPWLFSAKSNAIAIWADRARNLGSFDPYRREMFLGLGCAMTNLQLAAWKLGYSAPVISGGAQFPLSPPDTIVQAGLVALQAHDSRQISDADERLYNAIPHRHTNRGAYILQKAVPPDFLAPFLQDDSFKDGTPGYVRVVVLTGEHERADMAAIIGRATEAIISDPQMSADSARWFRTGKREILMHRDGVTMDTAGLSPLMRAAVKIAPDVDPATADANWLSMTRDVQTATTPLFGMILARDRLDIGQTVQAGMLWQRLHLAATVEGLAAQPMNQPVEMMDRNKMLRRKDEFGPALAKLANMPGYEPTFVFRMGYAEREALPSPRRPLGDVMKKP